MLNSLLTQYAGLDPRCTEEVLKQIFETTGHVVNVKIIPDKNVSAPVSSPPHKSVLPASVIRGFACRTGLA